MRFAISWNRISIAAIVMAGAVAVALVVPLLMEKAKQHREFVAAQLHPRPASDLEEMDILHALLRDDFFTSYGPLGPLSANPNWKPAFFKASDPIVLIGSTTRTCASHQVGCISLRDRQDEGIFILDEKLPARLLQELFAANQLSSPLPDPHESAIKYQPRTAIENLLSSPDRWNRFYATFPHTKYAIEISRAVLSPDGTHSLIHVQFWVLPRGEQGVLYYLVRARGAWRVESASGPEIY